jgi:hypothetical protein
MHAESPKVSSQLQGNSNAQANQPGVTELPRTAPRRLFDDRKPSPSDPTSVATISNTTFDDLLQEAHQYDSQHVATYGHPSQLAKSSLAASPDRNAPSAMEVDHHDDKKCSVAHGSLPFPYSGRGRGGRVPSHVSGCSGSARPKAPPPAIGNPTPLPPPVQNPPPALPAQQSAHNMENTQPDFSFSRPTYTDPTPPSPARKNFF